MRGSVVHRRQPRAVRGHGMPRHALPLLASARRGWYRL